jgi:hypothetical protein
MTSALPRFSILPPPLVLLTLVLTRTPPVCVYLAIVYIAGHKSDSRLHAPTASDAGAIHNGYTAVTQRLHIRQRPPRS